jgi:acetoin utilization deacetylase AcuC-like enzyme
LRSEEFSSRKDIVIKEGSQKASIADILKVHEYTYIEKFRKQIMRLEHSDNKVFTYTDGSDSAVSEKSWEAALVACGTTIEAVDAVVNGNFRNAFCATRPPGHHAGIFG